MTTNILLGIGVIWYFAIATAVDMAVAIDVCKHTFCMNL